MRHAISTEFRTIIILVASLSSFCGNSVAEFSLKPDEVQASGQCQQQQDQSEPGCVGTMGGEQSAHSEGADKSMEPAPTFEKTFDKEELKNRLTPLQFHCTQDKGTERAFTGEYYTVTDEGEYHCVVCDNLLFKSNSKYDSGSGWPSFYDMAEQGSVKMNEDISHGMKRVETVCAKCGAHLGHVFEDGPSEKTGQRYCINSSSLKFNPKKK